LKILLIDLQWSACGLSTSNFTDNQEEVLTNSMKTTSHQSQSKEIASWIQQRFASLMLTTLQAETRNDEV
jgi:hypothetical protein